MTPGAEEGVSLRGCVWGNRGARVCSPVLPQERQRVAGVQYVCVSVLLCSGALVRR